MTAKKDMAAKSNYSEKNYDSEKKSAKDFILPFSLSETYCGCHQLFNPVERFFAFI